MLTSQLAQKYAQAVYELASDKDMLIEAKAQLNMVLATIEEHSDLEIFLYHPRVQIEAKKETITSLFAQDLAEFVHKFLLLLVDKRREVLLPAIVREYTKLANAARNIIEAEVTVAMPLSEGEQSALIQKLSTVTGKNVTIQTKVDKRILGGVIVKIGDKLIDGSVARQLNMLQQALLTNDAAKIGVKS
ncbi:ATP synthase F1 subunit delta [Dendrosporobacter sp. 1207_IL3150]|uniref:ATP synthase F1 subunit delta n=1 Tax=Dendrosporobacter sp. 1207_IL3150 TaxID=3084054 RepID=UPI002FDB949B